MQAKNSLKYGWKTMGQRSTIILLLLFSFSFFQLFCAVHIFWELFREMSDEIEISCVVPSDRGNIITQLEKMNQVAYISEYARSVQVVSYNGYSVSVRLIGYEDDFFYSRFQNDIAVRPSGTMPYLVVESAVLDHMENEKQEKLDAELPDNFMLESFLVSGNMARVCGIVESNVEDQEISDESGEKIWSVYTTLNGYKALTNVVSGNDSVNITAETEELDFDVQSELSELSISDISGNSGQYYLLIGIRSGYNLKETIEWLNNAGISATVEDGKIDYVDEWDEKRDSGIRYIVWSFFAFISSLLLCNYQKKLWMIGHKAFIRYINLHDPSGKSVKNIYFGRILWYLAIGATTAYGCVKLFILF